MKATAFREHLFVGNEQYHRDVIRGLDMLAILDVSVAITARNVQRHIATVRQTLEALAYQTKTLRVCVYENDSTDNTVDHFKQWETEADGNLFVRLQHENNGRKRWGMVRNPDRGHHMAIARNRALDMIRLWCPQTHLTIVMDADLEAYSVDGIAHSVAMLADNPQTVGFAANGLRRDNGRWVQADAWAWRQGTWRPKPFSAVKAITPGRDHPTIPVLSAFGGLAIYRTEPLLTTKYVGGDCEHVSVHRLLREQGWELEMNPAMIVIYKG